MVESTDEVRHGMSLGGEQAGGKETDGRVESRISASGNLVLLGAENPFSRDYTRSFAGLSINPQIFLLLTMATPPFPSIPQIRLSGAGHMIFT